MKNLKFIIYISLLPPFILCGIGLFSTVHFFTDPDIAMGKHLYLWGILTGLLIWILEVRILYDIIIRYFSKK